MRVTLADDAVLFREGLARILAGEGFEITAQADDAESLLESVRATPPDVAIVDIRMPPTHTTEGLEAAREIRANHPGVGVLVLSQYVESKHAVELLEAPAGGIGYLLKESVTDIAEFVDAVRRVVEGGTVIDPSVVRLLLTRQRRTDPLRRLTEREREVLTLMAEGRSNQAISDKLVLSPRTVEAHVNNIFTKLDLARAQTDNRRVLAVLMQLRG
jgi:DNA-binding NarL/FixJ family response regulator